MESLFGSIALWKDSLSVSAHWLVACSWSFTEAIYQMTFCSVSKVKVVQWRIVIIEPHFVMPRNKGGGRLWFKSHMNSCIPQCGWADSHLYRGGGCNSSRTYRLGDAVIAAVKKYTVKLPDKKRTEDRNLTNKILILYRWCRYVWICCNVLRASDILNSFAPSSLDSFSIAILSGVFVGRCEGAVLDWVACFGSVPTSPHTSC